MKPLQQAKQLKLKVGSTRSSLPSSPKFYSSVFVSQLKRKQRIGMDEKQKKMLAQNDLLDELEFRRLVASEP